MPHTAEFRKDDFSDYKDVLFPQEASELLLLRSKPPADFKSDVNADKKGSTFLSTIIIVARQAFGVVRLMGLT